MINKELLLAAWLEKLQKKWDTEEYYYDVEEAKKVFKFVSKLTNDRGASRNFDLLEFQFEIVTEILCVKRREDGKRKHREAHINIPRKNGKSFLAAIIVVYLFFCQRHIFGALFILTANTTKQAGELYGTVEHFIKANKTLRRYCKITSSTKTIIRKDNGNKLMVLSSDADNADSFNDYVAVLDEIHQAKNDEMYGKLRTGQGAWDEPLIMTITTASSGEDPANPEMQLYTMAKKIEAGEVNDPSFYYRIYEADKDCNVEDETQWYKSNPALGVFRKLEDLANFAKRIRLMPLQENMFRRMFLNQHVALDHEKGAINMDLWDLCTKKVDTKDLEGWKCWGGLDLSSKNDITGFVLVFYEETTGRFIVVPYLYTPKETVAYRQHKDNNPYEYWIKKGDLIALDGKYVNFERFLDHAVELDEKYRIEQIGFDQWGSTTIINRLEDRWDVIPIGQGTKTMTQVINMNAEQKNFIEVVGAIASTDMKNSGVAASLTIAQAILESAWGKSELTKTGNALFGIKATSNWKGKTLKRKTTEYEDGKKVQVEAEFRAYATWEESVKDHSAFLKKYKRYAKVIGETDYKEACKAVAAAGYATDPTYAKNLIELIETYELYNYDTKNTETDNLEAEEKKYYRVQAGAFRKKEGAELMAEKIRKTGHKDVFVRMINGLYKVQAGAYTDRKNAEKTEKKLKAAGISCFIVCA